MSTALEIPVTNGDSSVNDGVGVHRSKLCSVQCHNDTNGVAERIEKERLPDHNGEGDGACRVFEDNSGALEMAKTHKYRPRTKHLNIRLHHFRDYVERGEISIHPIGTHDQPADFLTKALNEDTLIKNRTLVMGW